MRRKNFLTMNLFLREPHPKTEKDEASFAFVTYERR
jgi:hypothetical protein